MALKPKSAMVVQERTGVSLIELWDAGRYREAEAAAVGLTASDSETRLGLAMVEIARNNLGAARDFLTPLAFSADPFAGRAKSTLAYAYYLAGEVNEAKDLLDDTPDSFPKLLLKAIIETRPTYALKILKKAASYDIRPGLAGRLHNQRALAYRKIGDLDTAIQEYEAALYFFEEDQSDCIPLVMNNLARVYLEFKEFDKAHRHVDRAIALLRDDPPHLGKALDEKAQIYLAENKLEQAKHYSLKAISTLRATDRKEWLVEALLSYGRVLKAEHNDDELAVLQEAADVCRYLQREDLLIDVLQRRSEVSQSIFHSSEKLCIETALRVCGGYRAAAARLKTTHPRIMRLAKKHGIKLEK